MKHGTYGGFTRGCRCDPCREAKRAYDRGYWRDGRHRPLPPLTDRFWAKVKVGAPDECWAWIGNRNGQGYGIFKSGSDKYRGRVRAHRFALALSGVEVPDGLIVCHRCDNPPCCNPAHLFLGTHADNMRDMAAKGRSQRTNAHKTHCKRGHEFDAANTYVNKRGFRTCRACQAMHARALYRALKGDTGHEGNGSLAAEPLHGRRRGRRGDGDVLRPRQPGRALAAAQGWVPAHQGTAVPLKAQWSVEDDLRSHIDELERKLDAARREVELLTEERDAALYRVDELLERLA